MQSGKSKHLAKPPCICTHCGKPIIGKRTRDDVFPLCILLPGYTDSKIKVYSHPSCNNHSEEWRLAAAICVYDQARAEERLRHFRKREGKNELMKFVRSIDFESRQFYITGELTELFKKMFQGLRRWLLKNRWGYVPRCNMQVWCIRRVGPKDRAFSLPMETGVPNWYRLLAPSFPELKDWPSLLTHAFRGWLFGMTPCERWTLLHFKGRDNPDPLLLACLSSDNGGKTPPRKEVGGDHTDLNAEEEVALDRAWERMDRDRGVTAK